MFYLIKKDKEVFFTKKIEYLSEFKIEFEDIKYNNTQVKLISNNLTIIKMGFIEDKIIFPYKHCYVNGVVEEFRKFNDYKNIKKAVFYIQDEKFSLEIITKEEFLKEGERNIKESNMIIIEEITL